MFLNLYNNCQTIRVIEGIKEIARRQEDPPEHACENNSTFSSLDGLKAISTLSDINSREIFSTFQSIQSEVKSSKTSLDDIKEKNLQELIKSFKEALEENISGIGPLITPKEYETLVHFLLDNYLKEFTKFCSDLSSTKFVKEAINDIENGEPNNNKNGLSLHDLKRSVEVTVEENQDLIRTLLTSIDPKLNKNTTISIIEINGEKRELIKNTLTDELTIGRKVSDIAKSDGVLEIVRNLYHLLPESNSMEDTIIFINPDYKDPTEENIKHVIRLSQSEIEKGNLMNAQLSLEAAVRNGLRHNDITNLLKFAEKLRENSEIPGKVVTVDYKTPIPIGNRKLWIASGFDLNKISNNKRFKDNSFYLVGESISSETVELPDSKKVLVSQACTRFNNRVIKYAGLTATCIGNQIKFDLSSMSFESATNERLISAHKALVGSKSKKNQGLIHENQKNHDINARLFNRLEDLLKTLNEDLTGNDLREFIYDVTEGPNALFSTLDMHGDAGKAVEEWNTTITKKLRGKIFEICERNRDGNGTTATRKLLKKGDFLKIVNESDLNNFNTCIVLESILRWNLEFFKEEQDRECMFSYFDDGKEKLRSHTKTITGAEDEINIRLQKRMEEHMWKELPNMKFKIDSFSEENHPVVLKEEGGIKEVIISPELAYPIVRGKTSFFSTKYFEALETVMCYL